MSDYQLKRLLPNWSNTYTGNVILFNPIPTTTSLASEVWLLLFETKSLKLKGGVSTTGSLQDSTKFLLTKDVGDPVSNKGFAEILLIWVSDCADWVISGDSTASITRKQKLGYFGISLSARTRISRITIINSMTSLFAIETQVT